MAFNPSEIATIVVNGQAFRDWKTVLVHLAVYELYNYYRFTTSEDAPPPADWDVLRIKPGDHCSVFLGGILAISGYVVTRQVAYSAQHHVVEIIGKSHAWQLSHASAVVKGMELTNVNFQELATKLLGPFGIGYEHRGGISDKKFERVNVFGQTVWQVLELHARTAGVVLGDQPFGPGGTLVGTHPDYTQGHDAVVEGQNILEGREILSIEIGGGGSAPDATSGQTESTNERHGAAATHMPFTEQLSAMAQSFGAAGLNMPILVPSEVSGLPEHTKSRTEMEGYIRKIEQAKVDIVVQGWMKPSGGLWAPLMAVFVKSPMLIMNEVLHCKSVTFTQDDRTGTRTLLELWRNLKEASSPGAS